MPKQLTLKFTQNENTFDNFYPGPNEIALNLLKNFSRQTDIFCAYLWGAAGLGKTHLLKACVDENIQSVYFSAKNLNNDSLQTAFDNFTLICIDDIENICQNLLLEESIFHLYNHLQANNGHLIFSSTMPPKSLPLQLPDLKSRLTASFTIELNSLSDEEKLLILKTRATARGFDLSEEVMAFIITHFPRDMGKLISILDQLDEASLAEKRLVTVPFIKKIL